MKVKEKKIWITVIVILGFVVFFFGLLAFYLMFNSEHTYERLYSMDYVEIVKDIELKPKSQKIVNEFIAKKSTGSLCIEFHYNMLKSIKPWEDPRVEELYKLYYGTNIYLYNLTENKMIYHEIIKKQNMYSVCGPDITIWFASAIETKKGNKYRLVLKLPEKKETLIQFNKFKLVVGKFKISLDKVSL